MTMHPCNEDLARELALLWLMEQAEQASRRFEIGQDFLPELAGSLSSDHSLTYMRAIELSGYTFGQDGPPRRHT